MPKIAPYLTDKKVAALKEDGRYAVGGVPGLHLRVSGGHRGWVLRVLVGNQRRDIGLGAYPEVSLADAREQARELRKEIRRGEAPVTPTEAKKRLVTAQESVRTFKQCAEDFMASMGTAWKNPKHRQQWENTLKDYVYPKIGNLPVGDIHLEHVKSCLIPIWHEKTETASRIRGRIERVIDWATVHKLREGDNPARWSGNLENVLPSPQDIADKEHHRAVKVKDMAAFVVNLRQRDGLSARALEFVILTAARSGEVRGATWQEVDLVEKVWVIPAHRMKTKVEHRVPLSDAAVDLLKSLPRIIGCDFLFPGSRGTPLSDMSLTAVMRRMEVDAVPHGFRSSFRDWCGDHTEYPRDLAEAALAHKLESKVEAAYRRSDALERRREMMNAWAKFCGY